MISKTRDTVSQTKIHGQTLLDKLIDNTLVMAYRGLIKVRRTPEQLFDVTLQPVIFVLMFSYIFGGAISGNVRNYLPICIPGILVQTLMTAATVTGSQLREDMDKGVFNRFRSLPIARISPLAGALIADIIRYVIATILTFATGLMIGFRPYGGITGMIAAGLLAIFAAWSISWVFAFFGVIASSAASFTGISMLILMPLTFLSNAFAPTSTFPKLLQWIANNNPVSHLVSAVRQLTNHGMIGIDFWMSLLGSIAFILVFAPLTLNAYKKKT
jgi:ABC-2 type transport system permease protein